MDKNLENELVKKYPILYSDFRDRSCRWAIKYGACIGDGWFKILDELSAKLEKEVEKFENDPPKLGQIKEKFGLLRVYFQNTKHDVSKLNEMIWEVESLSTEICEFCGEAGSLKKSERGWMKTLCNKCEEVWRSGRRKR